MLHGFYADPCRAQKHVQEDKKNMTCAISAWSQVATAASISNVHGAMTLSSANAHGVQVLKNDIVCYIFLHIYNFDVTP